MDLQRLLIRGIENLLIFGFVVMIGMVFGNVVLRYGFDSGITMSDEASRMIFVWLTFGGAYLVAREGGHLGMNSVVAMFGLTGRWWCRLAAEALSLFCMALVVIGSWKQTVINIENVAPVTGLPVAVTYAAGIAAGIGIGALNLITIGRLLRGTIADNELMIGAESEELAAFEAAQAEKKRP
jgi:TRAP-type transport system small permease protein